MDGKLKRPDFLEYFTSTDGISRIVNVFCKCCGAKIQEGTLVRNHIGVKVPVLKPLDNYMDLYMSFEDADGVMRRKSTPMCSDCATKELTAGELAEIHSADTEIMERAHEYSGVKDDKVKDYLQKRAGWKMLRKIGVCVPGYVIEGEGR